MGGAFGWLGLGGLVACRHSLDLTGVEASVYILGYDLNYTG